MKAYLKSCDGLLALRPKITTIGRHEDSDIVLKSAGVEDHHAVIEFSPAENGFILRDFNSAHGTFVNDCHVQNAAVKVSPGDILRFGFSGTAFELVLEHASQVSCPPMSRRTAWPGPLQLAPETKPPPAMAAAPQFPFLPCPQSPPAVRSWAYGVSRTSPHPPRRKKPINAWGRPVSSPAFSPDLFGRTPAVMAGNGATTGPLTYVPQEDTLLKERDEMILKMGNEISRLSGLESECNRKDAVIADLQKEVASLTEKLAATFSPTESEFRQRLVGLDQDVAAKTEEVKALKEEISNLQKNTSEVLYHSLSERDLQIAHWKQETKTLKKNYSLTIGLVTSLQKEATVKEQKIQQLKMDAETFRRENREKDNRLAQVSAQCSKIKEETKRELRDREVNPLKNHIASLELQVKRSEEEIKTFRAEQEILSNKLVEKTQAEGDLKEECERRSQQLQEMGRRERLIKADMELAATQAQRFRDQVTEILFFPLPERSVTDQEIMEKLKQMQQNEEESYQKEMVLKEEICAKESKIQEISENMELLKKSLYGFQEFLKTSYCGNSLRKEISTLQNLRLTPPASEVQSLAAEVLCHLLSWVDAVEGLVHDVGLDVSSPAEKGVASYVKKLWDQHCNTTSQLQALQDQKRTIEESQHLLLQEKLKELKEQLEEDFQDKEKELLEAEEEHRKILEGTAAMQEAKLKEAIDEEKRKVMDLETQMKQLAQNAKIREHLESLAATERRKTLAEEQSAVWEKRLEKVEKEAEIQKRRNEEEISEYKEQVKQHSRTIVDLESKLVDSVQHVKKVKDENLTLQKQVEEMQRESCRSLPVGSQVASCTEGSHLFLKEDLDAAKEKIQSDEAVIAELKTELSGARARVSDIIGELGEKQKVELEQKQWLLHSQAHELSRLRENLLEMAQLVEQKDADLKIAREALRNSRDKLQEMVAATRGKAEEPEKAHQHKGVQTTAPLVDEAAGTRQGPAADLADLGARCRGCRHEETIHRQKDAVAELRQRIKLLEKGGPSDSKGRAAEPLIVLRKGLAEKKSQKPEEEQVTSPAAGAKTLQCGLSSTDPNLMIERTGRLGMADALDLSENLYLRFIQDLASLVNVKELGGLQTVRHLPQDEREKVGALRQKDAELLFDKVNQLKHRLERKESLLKEYERDMGKFRTSKQTLQACQSEIAKLAEKIYRESEEKALLKEALERTKLQLIQEKRLNRSLKHRQSTEKKSEVLSCYPCTLKARDRKTATPEQPPLPESPATAVGRGAEAPRKVALRSAST
nr:forkhead-associated domain-containing protein 1 [Pogona vitticeps]